ncbi:MAG: hypothetical protein WC900_01230 [Oscillospiraceae bacterium]
MSFDKIPPSGGALLLFVHVAFALFYVALNLLTLEITVQILYNNLRSITANRCFKAADAPLWAYPRRLRTLKHAKRA